jgi:hypothetical protein
VVVKQKILFPKKVCGKIVIDSVSKRTIFALLADAGIQKCSAARAACPPSRA